MHLKPAVVVLAWDSCSSVRCADGSLSGVQGLAVALKCGATKAQFDATVNDTNAHNSPAY